MACVLELHGSDALPLRSPVSRVGVDGTAPIGGRGSALARIRCRREAVEHPPERMKANAAHVVPLTAPVVAILERLPRFDSGDYLFTSTQGRKPISGFNRAKRALDAKMLAELCEL